jgi:hypothetical protein
MLARAESRAWIDSDYMSRRPGGDGLPCREDRETGCDSESTKKPAPGLVPILVRDGLKAEFRGPHFRENRGQFTEESFDTVFDLLRLPLEGQVSFERGLRQIFGYQAIASHIKKKRTEGVMGNRMNGDGYFEPTGTGRLG